MPHDSQLISQSLSVYFQKYHQSMIHNYLRDNNFLHFLFGITFQVFVVFMWAVAIALNLAILYGIHPYYQDNLGIIEPAWLNNLY